jgi:monovalent cation/hydrogen antiporter
MRGAVSLAAALALPLAARGHPFPERDTVIFIAYVAIVLTLVIPGLTLPRLVFLLGIGEHTEVARAEAAARVQLAHAALQRIEDAAEREHLTDGAVAQLRALYESRIHRLEPQADGDGHHGDESDRAWRLRRLHRELIGAERDRLRDLRRKGEISSDSQRRIQRDLDLE